MTTRDPVAVIREAARNRTRLIDATREESAAIEKERAQALRSERATPKTTGTPSPEGPLPTTERT